MTVCVMVMSPVNQPTGFDHQTMKYLKAAIRAFLPIAAGVLFLFCLSGCNTKDVDGNTPEDVVRRFVECARTKDYTGAAACWRVGDAKNIEANRDISFEKYCEYFECDTYKVELEGMDKGFYWIGFTGLKDGKEKYRRLFMDGRRKEKSERWLLGEDRWIPESAQRAGKQGQAL